MLSVQPIKTRIFTRSESLHDFLLQYLEGYDLEGKILAITSKIISVAEDRFTPFDQCDKRELIQREADAYLGECKYNCHLTIKEGSLILSAGIDESNSETGEYILYPHDPFKSSQQIHRFLIDKLSLKKFGILLTDSRTTLLRKGVSGFALAYCGFRGLNNKVGTRDLFQRPLKVTAINTVDSLAAAATLCMGEGDESCPLALVNYPVEFVDITDNSEIKISPEEDIYWPVLTGKV